MGVSTRQACFLETPTTKLLLIYLNLDITVLLLRVVHMDLVIVEINEWMIEWMIESRTRSRRTNDPQDIHTSLPTFYLEKQTGRYLFL